MRNTRTIAKLIADGMALRVYCNKCWHSADVDLEELKAVLGPDHGSMAWDLAPRFVCSMCDAKSVSFTFSPLHAVGMPGSRGR